jgi:hypothetical protein
MPDAYLLPTVLAIAPHTMTDSNEPALPNSATSQPAPAAAQPAAPTAEELKQAYQAFKKRWKLTRLDHESRVGRSPLSSGGQSSIGGISPPNQFSRAVWDALVEQGKLKYVGQGMYAMK